ELENEPANKTGCPTQHGEDVQTPRGGTQTVAHRFPTPLVRLSGHEHNYGDVRCAEFGLWPGARREHIPKWICDRRATPPQAKFGATLRAAVLFRPDIVARSLQTPEGYARRSRLVWPKNPSPRTTS